MWAPPVNGDFRVFFARDFYFATADAPNNMDFVTDADVTRAINEANINFNASLFGTDAQVTNVFMYLAAFYLVRNIQLSTKGLAAQNKFFASSVNIGGVSTSYHIPEIYSKDPFISSLAENRYGQAYLGFLLPCLAGNVILLDGGPTL